MSESQIIFKRGWHEGMSVEPYVYVHRVQLPHPSNRKLVIAEYGIVGGERENSILENKGYGEDWKHQQWGLNKYEELEALQKK